MTDCIKSLGNLWIKRRKLLNKLWTALITICYQICVMMNLWDTYWPKCIWQHSFPLFLFSFITYLVDSHALTTKRTARSTHKQMQNDFKHCVLRIPSYTFWRIFGFICSSLAKYTYNFQLGVPVRNYRWEHYFQATFQLLITVAFHTLISHICENWYKMFFWVINFQR